MPRLHVEENQVTCSKLPECQATWTFIHACTSQMNCYADRKQAYADFTPCTTCVVAWESLSGHEKQSTMLGDMRAAEGSQGWISRQALVNSKQGWLLGQVTTCASFCIEFCQNFNSATLNQQGSEYLPITSGDMFEWKNKATCQLMNSTAYSLF